MCPGETKAKSALSKIDKNDEEKIISIIKDPSYVPLFIIEFLEPKYQTLKIKELICSLGTLEYVSEPAYEMCKMAVLQNAWNLSFVPSKFKDENMILASCNSKKCAGYAIQYCKNFELNKDHYKAISKNDPYNLLKILGDDLDDEIIDNCLRSKNGAFGIQFLNEKLTKERISIACNSNNDVKDTVYKGKTKCFKNVYKFLKEN